MFHSHERRSGPNWNHGNLFMSCLHSVRHQPGAKQSKCVKFGRLRKISSAKMSLTTISTKSLLTFGTCFEISHKSMLDTVDVPCKSRTLSFDSSVCATLVTNELQSKCRQLTNWRLSMRGVLLRKWQNSKYGDATDKLFRLGCETTQPPWTWLCTWVFYQCDQCWGAPLCHQIVSGNEKYHCGRSSCWSDELVSTVSCHQWSWQIFDALLRSIVLTLDPGTNKCVTEFLPGAPESVWGKAMCSCIFAHCLNFLRCSSNHLWTT